MALAGGLLVLGIDDGLLHLDDKCQNRSIVTLAHAPDTSVKEGNVVDETGAGGDSKLVAMRTCLT